MKHYVVCENKCLIESYTKNELYNKDEIDSQIYKKSEVYTKEEVDNGFNEIEVATLDTTGKTVVSAINEVHSEHDVLSGNVGNVAELKTTDKTVVGAINELHDEHDVLAGNVGDVTGLNTVSQNVVGAINETLAMAQGGIANIFNVVYPVGSLYWSSKPTNPAELFGGTWTQIKDKFVLTAGDTYSVNTTGGNANTTLITANLPSHTHSFTPSGSVKVATNPTFTGTAVTSGGMSANATGGLVLYSYNDSADCQGNVKGNNPSRQYFNNSNGNQSLSILRVTNDVSHTHSVTAKGTISGGAYSFTGTAGVTEDTGSGTAFSNMPPYVVKYCWERTA